jgi:chemotaxis protein CheX
MSSATLEPAADIFTDPLLTRAATTAVTRGFQMCGLQATLVGLARVPVRETGSLTGLIGIHGKVSGFVTLNLSESLAIRAVEGLLGEPFGKLTPQVIDGTGEIANIVTGGMKSQLAGSSWAFGQITVPSMIVGRGYQIAFAKGLEFLAATFELADDTSVMLEDRLATVCLSLLRL